jgi:ABC-2 type transport system permease protein
MNSFTIAGRELRSLFLSPLAWSLLAVTQLILAYLFLSQLDYYLSIQPKLAGLVGSPGVTDLVVAPIFGNAAVILLLITPLITMRLISDERKNKTINLLFSAPVSMSEIIFGKFLATFSFLMLILFLLTLMPLSLLTIGELDLGKFCAGILGMVLLLASFAALGLYMSTIAPQATIAAVGSFGVLLLLWIIDWGSNVSDGGSSILGYLSILQHFEQLLKGSIRSTDIVYFVLFISSFLILSIKRLDNDRLQK